MRKRWLINLYVILSCAMGRAEMISSTRFDDVVSGVPMSMERWQQAGFQTGSWDSGLDDRTLVDTLCSYSGRQSLRIEYPKGGYGPQMTGAQVELKFNPIDEAYMSYWIRFSENFSFGTTSEGGKLPGLCGGKNCSGGAMCDGTNGFSARFMWRAGGQIVLYLYHIDKPDKYGEDHELKYADGSNVVFERGVWHHIEERVRINSDGERYDGEVQAWVDGREVLSLGGLRFTTNGDKVDKLYISTFHGGDDESWAPTETCHVWLDDIRIGTSRDDTGFRQCKPLSLGGGNRPLCASSPLTLADSSLSADRYTWTWTKNGAFYSDRSAISTSESGAYLLVADGEWCSSRDSVRVTDGIVPTLSGERVICGSSFETLHSGVSDDKSLSFEWWRDNQLLPDTLPFLRTKEAGVYRVRISAKGCEESSASVTVTSHLLPLPDVVGEPGGEVEVWFDTDLNWFEENADEPFFVGKNCVVRIPEEGRSYLYVSDANAFSDYVGKRGITVALSYTENRFDRKMRFEVYRDLSIDSLSIYSVEAQYLTLRVLREADEEVVWRRDYSAISAGEHRLPIGASLSPGVYWMDAVGSTGRLRYSHAEDSDIHFPYTVEGVISITGSNIAWIDAKPYYLFFYNWKVSAGNTCARTPVLVSGSGSTRYVDSNSAGLTCFCNKGMIHILSESVILGVDVYGVKGDLLWSAKNLSVGDFSCPSFGERVVVLRVTTSSGVCVRRVVLCP